MLLPVGRTNADRLERRTLVPILGDYDGLSSIAGIEQVARCLEACFCKMDLIGGYTSFLSQKVKN